MKAFKEISGNSSIGTGKLLQFMAYFGIDSLRKKYVKQKTSNYLKKSFVEEYLKKDIFEDIIFVRGMERAQTTELNHSIRRLLRFEDRNSMAFSVESRVPFLDYEFVEMAYNMPDEYKIYGGRSKALLREYMKDKMTLEVVERKDKLGFAVPSNAWIKQIKEHYKEILLDKPRSEKFFEMDKVREAFESEGSMSALFPFIMIETWMRVHNVKVRG